MGIHSYGLLDEVEDGEHRHVEGHDHAADKATDGYDHQRLDQAGERLGGLRDLLVVELRDLVQQDLDRALVLTDRDHLRDH